VTIAAIGNSQSLAIFDARPMQPPAQQEDNSEHQDK
jgi:hypothetical protein